MRRSILLLTPLILFGCLTSPPMRRGSSSALHQAEAFFETGEFQKAVRAYRQVLADSPSEAERERAQYRLAFTLSFHRNPDRDYAAALEEYRKAVSVYPDATERPLAENMRAILTELLSEKAELRRLRGKLVRLQQLEMDAEERRGRAREFSPDAPPQPR